MLVDYDTKKGQLVRGGSAVYPYTGATTAVMQAAIARPHAHQKRRKCCAISALPGSLCVERVAEVEASTSGFSSSSRGAGALAILCVVIGGE